MYSKLLDNDFLASVFKPTILYFPTFLSAGCLCITNLLKKSNFIIINSLFSIKLSNLYSFIKKLVKFDSAEITVIQQTPNCHV